MSVRPVALVVVAALVVGAGPAPATGAAGPEGSPSAHHKKKRKHRGVRCRRTQVPIKLGRRAVGCRSKRAALPPPHTADPRLVLAGAALGDDLRGLRDRRGRRPPSLKKMFRKVNRRAFAVTQTGISRGMALLDGLAARNATAARLGRAAAQPRDCNGGSQPTLTDTFSSSAGGITSTGKATLGRLGIFDLTLEGHGYSISVSITTDGCSGFDAPACPTADGVVEGTDSSLFKVSVKVAKGDTVLTSRAVDFRGKTRLHAQVGDDAKLDFIDVDDTQTADIDLGGANQEFGPVNLIYTGLHHARVDMPGGGYVPDLSAVDISLTARGVTVGRSAMGAVGNDIAADLDRKFAALVAAEIDHFRALETGWNHVPNDCVKVEWSPGSRTLKLHKGQHGTVSAQATAARGGGASPGRWAKTAQANASFTPDQATGTGPSFSYDVTNSGKDVIVSLGVRVTSKAGVGEGTWEQETDDQPLYRGTIEATYTVHGTGCGQSWNWSYSGSLGSPSGDDPFPILDPGSNPEGGGAAGYDETLSGTYSYPPCGSLPGCSTNLSIAQGTYGFLLIGADADTIYLTMEPPNIDAGDCDSDLINTLPDATFPRSQIGADTITVHFPYDDGTVQTTGTLTLTRVDQP